MTHPPLPPDYWRKRAESLLAELTRAKEAVTSKGGAMTRHEAAAIAARWHSTRALGRAMTLGNPLDLALEFAIADAFYYAIPEPLRSVVFHGEE